VSSVKRAFCADRLATVGAVSVSVDELANREAVGRVLG
jgi:hypothetical protein